MFWDDTVFILSLQAVKYMMYTEVSQSQFLLNDSAICVFELLRCDSFQEMTLEMTNCLWSLLLAGVCVLAPQVCLQIIDGHEANISF